MQLLTIPEVAEVLRISGTAVYRLIHRESLSSYRVGCCYRVSREDLEEYLKRRHTKAKTPKGLCFQPTVNS